MVLLGGRSHPHNPQITTSEASVPILFDQDVLELTFLTNFILAGRGRLRSALCLDAQNNFPTDPKGADQQLQRQRQLSYLMQTNTHASSSKF